MSPNEFQATLGKDEKEWPFTMDAVVWADAWLSLMKNQPELSTDRELLIAWFANAIMAGYDGKK